MISIKKLISVTVSASLCMGIMLLPITSIPASAKASGSIQVNKSSQTEDDNVETFGSYTFTLPESFDDCEKEGDPYDEAVYYYLGDYDDVPALMILKESLLDYVTSSELKTLTEDDEYEILGYFKEGVLEGEDFTNVSETSKTKIAGNPAITFSFTGELYGENDVRITVFIDKEEVNIYCLMLLEEAGAKKSYVKDMEKIEKSFKKSGESDIPEDLAAAVYEALEDVSSYSARSVFELVADITDSGESADLTLIMDHELEALLGKNKSCHMILTESMFSDELGIKEGDYVTANEFYILTDGKSTSAYYKEDGEDWETEDLESDSDDLEEIEEYIGSVYDFEFFEKLADGSIDYEVDPELSEIDESSFYVMQMDLTGDDLKLAVETQFFLSGVFLEDEIDYDDITSHMIIYVDSETFLPSTVEIDLAGVGEQILFEMIGFEDADISSCSLVTDYTGFDEFDEIEAPDI